MKILNKAAISTIAIGSLSFLGGTQAHANGLGDTDFKVTADVLNVRNQPNTKTGVVVKKLKQGAVVRPVELSKDKAWARIGKDQWVSFQYLKMINDCNIPVNGDDYTYIEPTDYIITVTSLNVRRAANTNSTVLRTVKKDDVVSVSKMDGKWLFVDNMGWIHGDYAKKFVGESNIAKPSYKEETVSLRQLNVTANVLNVRQDPTTDSKVIRKLYKGDYAMSNIKSGAWYKIQLDGAIFGWIHEDYVTVELMSLNSNSTWDELLDPPAMDDTDTSINATYDDLVDVAPGEVDMTRTVTVPANDVLNVRYSVNLGGSVKDTLANGTKVTVITDYGKASRIKYINSRGVLEFGYVASRYLK